MEMMEREGGMERRDWDTGKEEVAERERSSTDRCLYSIQSNLHLMSSHEVKPIHRCSIVVIILLCFIQSELLIHGTTEERE